MSFLELDVIHSKGDKNFSFHLELERGRYGITGPSGGGKTTLLNLIAGLETPMSGKIKLDSQILFNSNPAENVLPEKRHIGYVFQHLLLFNHLDVLSNITYSWKFDTTLEDQSYLNKILETFNLASELSKYPKQLSGGQKQRVAIARALLMKPKLLLLDESFTNVDKQIRKTIGDHLLEIIEEYKMPMIMVSHDLADLESYCETIIPLEDGKINFP